MIYLSFVVDNWVSLDHYDVLVKYSTSMQQIYYMLHNDYDNLLDLIYSATKIYKAVYKQYSTPNLTKNCEVIKYKNNLVFKQDEKVSP